LVSYFLVLFRLLSVGNIYVVWLIIEIAFLYFFLVVIGKEIKNIGLIIYFFFQRFISLLLWISFVFSLDKLIFLMLIAKLGLFPFFYWIVIVRVKVGVLRNIFVLSLQKFSVFWLVWLTVNVRMVLVYVLVYFRIFFCCSESSSY